MTLTEFLLARIAEDEAAATDVLDRVPAGTALLANSVRFYASRVLAECEAKRRIVEFHDSWPVLMETPPVFENVDPDYAQSMVMRATQQIQWLTEQEYRKRFGDEPPTAPMLVALAAVYADHPDYDEAWRP